MTTAAERIDLAPGYSISRIINGCWQLSPTHGGGPGSKRAALDRFAELVANGYTTFDCADIYEGTEELLGQFRRSLADPDSVQLHTKYVPDKSSLAGLGRADVAQAVDRSLRRLGVERIDLLQFHWWSYDVPGIEEVMDELDSARAAGKIHLIGLTNFDTPHLEAMIEAGFPVVSMQTQYSLLDRRPENGLNDFAKTSGVHLLAYGSIAGGFLNQQWLAAPSPSDMNRSLQKYRLIIMEAGGWDRFQGLLQVLDQIARKHGVTVSTVAARWVLDRPAVAAIILGTGRTSRVPGYADIAALSLDEADLHAIDRCLDALVVPPGDTYELERDPAGKHRGIIKTDLRNETGAGR
jgi:aryl-alcohol dehydrogenase-like predicted oxidoreductase